MHTYAYALQPLYRTAPQQQTHTTSILRLAGVPACGDSTTAVSTCKFMESSLLSFRMRHNQPESHQQRCFTATPAAASQNKVRWCILTAIKTSFTALDNSLPGLEVYVWSTSGSDLRRQQEAVTSHSQRSRRHLLLTWELHCQKHTAAS